MLKTCKLTVLIPVYNESPEILLRPLESLIKQNGIKFENFEVVFVVNNSRLEAINKDPAFLSNQQALEILSYAGRLRPKYFFSEVDELKSRWKNIRESGLVIRVIDQSSEKKSEIQNTVGLARNRAGMEVCKDFLTQAAVKENGIIVSADCDCRFSENYIAGIAGNFDNYRLLSLSGNLELESDPSQNFGDVILKATKLHLNWHLIKPLGRKITIFDRADGEKLNRLITINTAVTVKAWMAVGGFPNMHSLEDLFFCKKIFMLPGKIAKSDEFTVFILNRVSHRAGALSLGRRVGIIGSAVEEYQKGNTNKLFVPDARMFSRFYLMLVYAVEQKALNSSLLQWLMENNNFKNLDSIKVRQLNIIAQTIQNTFKTAKNRDYAAMENLIVKYLFGFLPQRDITTDFLKD